MNSDIALNILQYFYKKAKKKRHSVLECLFFCHRLESNQPHADFQSAALPTELQRRRDVFNNIEK